MESNRPFESRSVPFREQRFKAGDVARDARSVELDRLSSRADDVRSRRTEGAAELGEGLPEAAAGLRLGPIRPQQGRDLHPRHPQAALRGQDREQRPGLSRLERNGPTLGAAQLEASQRDELVVEIGQVHPWGVGSGRSYADFTRFSRRPARDLTPG